MNCMRDRCGVFGVFSLDEHDVSEMLFTGLEALQHRGQESWGIAVINSPPYKKMGLVSRGYEENYREISK